MKYRLRITFTKYQVTVKKKLGQMDKNTAEEYEPTSQNFSKSKIHSLSAAHEQKCSLAQKKLFHTTISLTFTIRSKRRLNKKFS